MRHPSLPRPTRLLVPALAVLCLAATVPAPAEATPAHHTLRELAAARGLPLGTAVNESALRQDPTYRTVLDQQFSSVTAESSMKWKAIEAAPGVRDYSTADSLVATARGSDQRVWGHTLVWYKGTPQWLTDAAAAGEYSTEELRQLLKDHVQQTVRHFGDDVWAWDVANEVLNDDGTLRDDLWLRELGEGYIADSFRWAHEANPDAKLFINDFNIEWDNRKSRALLELVQGLRADGVPIDGVGFQTHRQGALPADYDDVLRSFTDAGFDVAVTEMDKRVALPVTEAGLAEQTESYRRALAICLELPRCVSFSVWGFTDRYSWVTGPEYGAATLSDADYVWKPAHAAMLKELRGRRGHRS